MNFDILTWLLVFIRLGALLAVFPLFSAHNFPVQLRVALGALTAFLVAPTVPPAPAAVHSLAGVTGLMLMEGGIGLLLGFVSRMIFFALDFAGGIIATEMGLTFTPDVDPFSSGSIQAPGLLLYFLGAMLLFSLDLHHWMLAGFQRTYAILPIGAAHLREALLADLIVRSGKIFSAGIQIAAPIMAVSFIITLMFSVLSRAVPQMNVFAESFPVRTMAGLAVFGLTLNLMAQQIMSYLRRIPEDFLRVAQLLAS